MRFAVSLRPRQQIFHPFLDESPQVPHQLTSVLWRESKMAASSLCSEFATEVRFGRNRGQDVSAVDESFLHALIPTPMYRSRKYLSDQIGIRKASTGILLLYQRSTRRCTHPCDLPKTQVSGRAAEARPRAARRCRARRYNFSVEVSAVVGKFLRESFRAGLREVI
jgi:hypothetical protein